MSQGNASDKLYTTSAAVEDVAGRVVQHLQQEIPADWHEYNVLPAAIIAVVEAYIDSVGKASVDQAVAGLARGILASSDIFAAALGHDPAVFRRIFAKALNYAAREDLGWSEPRTGPRKEAS